MASSVRPRPVGAAFTLVLAALLAVATPAAAAPAAAAPAATVPARGGPGGRLLPPRSVGLGLAAARAEAARLAREVARLDTQVEVLAEAHGTAQARLNVVIQAAHRQQAALEQADAALQAANATFADDVRDLYARGPLAPLGLLLGARDGHELALARGVAVGVLERDRRALALIATATAEVGVRVAELEATQAEALALRQRLAAHQAAIGARLADRRAMLATARAEVRAQVQAEQARQEAVRLALLRAAAARSQGLGFGLFADVPAPTAAAAAAVRAALDQVGRPYRWGATGPGSFDCSGLVRWAYARAGVALPRTSREQWWAGAPVGPGALRPGDLVFWATDPSAAATIHHVGVYVGQGLMVHAPHTGALVRVDPMRSRGYAGATRPTSGARTRVG
jgi:cell wall-associated NlpC family hydrolase